MCAMATLFSAALAQIASKAIKCAISTLIYNKRRYLRDFVIQSSPGFVEIWSKPIGLAELMGIDSYINCLNQGAFNTQ
jgi:hypothetical protein